MNIPNIDNPLANNPVVNQVTENVQNNFKSLMTGTTLVSKFFKVGVISIIVIIIIEIIRGIYNYFEKRTGNSPWLLKGTKKANKRLVILQDPSKEGAITLNKSNNELGGLEFSYSFWMFIDDWSFRYNKWKHVLHKGNSNAELLRTPGIYLHKKENALRVYMSTFNSPKNEFFDVMNIPLNKWVHIVVAVRQRFIDVFINGNLVKSHKLKHLPKQNTGDVYINSNNGFGGYMSNIKYNDYYISFSEIESLVNQGPAPFVPSDNMSEKPPYFSQNWWANSF